MMCNTVPMGDSCSLKGEQALEFTGTGSSRLGYLQIDLSLVEKLQHMLIKGLHTVWIPTSFHMRDYLLGLLRVLYAFLDCVCSAHNLHSRYP